MPQKERNQKLSGLTKGERYARKVARINNTFDQRSKCLIVGFTV